MRYIWQLQTRIPRRQGCAFLTRSWIVNSPRPRSTLVGCPRYEPSLSSDRGTGEAHDTTMYCFTDLSATAHCTILWSVASPRAVHGLDSGHRDTHGPGV